MGNYGLKFKVSLSLLISIMLISFLTLSCAIGEDEAKDGDDNNNSGIKCDIGCYKDLVINSIDCLRKNVDCYAQGGNIVECNEKFATCLESAEDRICNCAKNCNSYIEGSICTCLDSCEPYPEGGECKFECWNKLCDGSGWFDCNCSDECFNAYRECIADAEYPYDQQELQLALQCVDAFETCWLGCIAD